MKTRVAVRDKNPHRFQVVPLRDAGKLHVTTEQASRLTMPTPPTNYSLRSPSGMLSPYAQSRLLHSSLSAQSLLANPLKENRHSEDMELNVNKTLAASDSKALIASASSLASFNLHNQGDRMISVLSERDMNRERPRAIVRKPENSRRSSHKATAVRNWPSIGILSESFCPDPAQTHTTSRSLHLKSPQARNYPKFTSLTDIQALRIARADVILESTNTRKDNKETQEVELFSSSPDTHVLLNPRSKKRHAIYTASLFLPDFEQPDYFERAWYNSGDQPISDATLDKMPEHEAMNFPFQQDPDQTIRQDFPELAVHLLDKDVSQSTLHGSNIFETSTWGSMGLLPFESPQHHSSPKATSPGLRLTHGLSFSKPSRIRPTLDLNPDKIVYPRIVLDLFAEIDKAIKEWSPPLAF
ncbi:hypothetical protein GALMADRAFT_235727 [Galerina marginata CBS 339.88]|uniref:Uncharacterized protein n=1 Tax=Galerina marginata (strain CBS 339.88) TaxID=685588 RepID=A0A067TJY9_GALM3|nr:hypothetical protein GALMADRAFT_235727 [Galerina marginata CBS 339.88]